MSEKILFVDDEQNVLDAYQRNLRSNFEVVTITSGMEAIKLLQDAGPFPVIVSDYRMPEMDGIQFLLNAKRLAPDSIRILLTGAADVETVMEAARNCDLFRYLVKPCPNELLLETLTAAVEKHQKEFHHSRDNLIKRNN